MSIGVRQTFGPGTGFLGPSFEPISIVVLSLNWSKGKGLVISPVDSAKTKTSTHDQG